MIEAIWEFLFGTEPISIIQRSIGLGHPLPFRILSLFGDTWGILWVVGVSLWLFGRRAMVAVLGIVAAGGLTKVLLSSLFSHSRPEGPGIVIYEHLQLSSLPSGHVYQAVGPWGLLYALELAPLWVPILIAILVGLGRLYLAAHFVGDVLAGILLGALLVWGYVRLWPGLCRWLSRRSGIFFAGLAVVAIAAVAVRLPMFGSQLRQFEVLGLVGGATVALPLQRRLLPLGDGPVSTDGRILKVALGTTGIVAFLLLGRASDAGAELRAGVTAGLATVWTLVAVPALSARVSGYARHASPPGR